jgi:hypothetical protein
MVGPSTKRALNTRALDAANWLQWWTERLADIAVTQDKGFFHKGSRTALTLQHSDVMDLWNGMHEHIRQIRRYAEPPLRSARRSPSGFRP